MEQHWHLTYLLLLFIFSYWQYVSEVSSSPWGSVCLCVCESHRRLWQFNLWSLLVFVRCCEFESLQVDILFVLITCSPRQSTSVSKRERDLRDAPFLCFYGDCPSLWQRSDRQIFKDLKHQTCWVRKVCLRINKKRENVKLNPAAWWDIWRPQTNTSLYFTLLCYSIILYFTPLYFSLLHFNLLYFYSLFLISTQLTWLVT